MDLTRIEATSFCGLEHAVLDLTTPVTVLCGPNGAGKSSFRDAVRWGLTGLARGVTKKNAAAVLGLKGKKPKVTLTIGGEEYSRTLSGSTLPEARLAAKFGHPDMLAAVCDSFVFIEKSPRDRAELVRALSTDGAKLAGAARAELGKVGLAAGEIEYLAELVAADLDKAESAAVESRRAAKRRLEELPAEPPEKLLDVDGTAYDLAACKLPDIEKRLTDYRKAVEKVAEQRGALLLDDPAGAEARIREIEDRLFEISEVDPKRRIELGNAHVRALEAQRAAETAAAKADGERQAAKEAYSKAERLKGKCPLCRTVLTDQAIANLLKDLEATANRAYEAHEKAGRAVESAKAEVRRLADEHKAAADAEAEVARLQPELADLRVRVAAQAKAVQALADADKQLADLRAKEDLGQKIIAAKRTYDEAVAKYAGRADLEAEVERWDKAQKVLGTEGPVRKLAASGFDLAAVQAHVDCLLPGGRLDADPDWNITYTDEARGTRPVEMTSRSEHFRLGCAFAAALSKAAGVGLLLLDEAEVLVGPSRSGFMDWLAAQAGDFDRVIAFASVPECPGPSADEWLTIAWVEDGKVSLVGEALPA